MKFLRVSMPDGTRWDVPAHLIAENRARYWAEADPETTYEKELEIKDWAIADWAARNMNRPADLPD